MDCFECDSEETVTQETIAYKYKESGLDNITLQGVIRSSCSECGEETLNFGDVAQLHCLIAMTLVKKKNLLTGKEVRFLRKYLGYNSSMFAKILSKSPEYISRIENGSDEVKSSFDRLVRFAVVSKIPDRHYDLHDQILNESGTVFKNIKIEKKDKGWEVVSEAA